MSVEFNSWTDLCLQACLTANQKTTDMGLRQAMERHWTPSPVHNMSTLSTTGSDYAYDRVQIQIQMFSDYKIFS